MKTIFPIITALISIFFITFGVIVFGFWDETAGPLSGFFPAIIGSVLLLVSIISIVTSFGDKKEAKFYSSEFYIIIAAVITFLMGYLIGFMPSLFIFLISWMKIIEKSSWKQSLLLSVSVTTALFAIFSIWLEISFPKGLFFDMIFG